MHLYIFWFRRRAFYYITTATVSLRDASSVEFNSWPSHILPTTDSYRYSLKHAIVGDFDILHGGARDV